MRFAGILKNQYEQLYETVLVLFSGAAFRNCKKSRSARFMELDTSHYLVAYQYVWYPSRFLICAEPPGFLIGIHNCAVPFFLAFYSN